MSASLLKHSDPAIVLCLTGTGMATVRTLAEAGVNVHAFIFRQNDPVYWSRYARKIDARHLTDDEALLKYLIAYAKQLGGRPVVFPTSDTHALLLAKHHLRLSEYCRVWSNSYENLSRIINKDSLYRIAEHAGIATVPAIYNASAADIKQWSLHNPAPYLLKPPFEGVATSCLRGKNLQLQNREELIDYIDRNDTQALIVQRLLRGGDGHIYDCYGLCDARGRVLAMASHRRLRQHLADFGATCFGEIPSGLPVQQDEQLFASTAKLLRETRYHGIFGIEWLHERGTDNFYLIDFNARPFSSIGHLQSCGVNLPWLAYRELLGDELANVEARPAVKHKYWIDLDRDIQSFREKRNQGQLTIRHWLWSLVRCRSFAYFNYRDPAPGLYSLAKVVAHIGKFAIARLGLGAKQSQPARHPDVGTLAKRV